MQPHQAQDTKNATAPNKWEHAHCLNSLFRDYPVIKARAL